MQPQGWLRVIYTSVQPPRLQLCSPTHEKRCFLYTQPGCCRYRYSHYCSYNYFHSCSYGFTPIAVTATAMNIQVYTETKKTVGAAANKHKAEPNYETQTH